MNMQKTKNGTIIIPFLLLLLFLTSFIIYVRNILYYNQQMIIYEINQIKIECFAISLLYYAIDQIKEVSKYQSPLKIEKTYSFEPTFDNTLLGIIGIVTIQSTEDYFFIEAKIIHQEQINTKITCKLIPNKDQTFTISSWNQT